MNALIDIFIGVSDSVSLILFDTHYISNRPIDLGYSFRDFKFHRHRWFVVFS